MSAPDYPNLSRQVRTLVWLAAAQLTASAGIGIAPFFFDHRAPDHVLFPGFFMGLAFAVVGLLAAWLALGPLPAIVRWPGALGGVFFLGVVFILFFAGGPGPDGRVAEVILVIGSAVAIQFLVSQIPLWFLRLRFGVQMRTAADNGQPTGPGETQFTLRHLLVATTVIAVMLGIARALLAGLSIQRGPNAWEPVRYFAVFAAFNAAVLWLTLGAVVSQVSWKLGFPLVLVALAPLTWLECQAFYAITLLRGNHSDVIFILLVINYVQFGWQFGCLFALRWAGFRLGTR